MFKYMLLFLFLFQSYTTLGGALHPVTDPQSFWAISVRTLYCVQSKDQKTTSTYHTITSKSRMDNDTVAAFVCDTEAIFSTTARLRSVAIVVHVAYAAIPF